MAAVPIYWLDTNVFIQAKNGPYKFKVFGVFWAFLHEQIEAGTIRCPKMVYQEIVNNEEPRDDLANWIKTRRQSGLFVDPNADVQNAMSLPERSRPVADRSRNSQQGGSRNPRIRQTPAS